jgi:two-component sensor histidine kinase
MGKIDPLDLVETIREGKTGIESEFPSTDRAIPIGLRVNELVTNAVKYAFPGDTMGTVLVTLKRVPGGPRLTAAANGQGVDARRADSGSAPGWSKVLPNSSAANSSARATAGARPCA